MRVELYVNIGLETIIYQLKEEGIGLERGMRLCEICDLKYLGDEYHYIGVL